ncbi:MAG: ABC transporter ATP-binding protein [Microthrixaceae bacterium]
MVSHMGGGPWAQIGSLSKDRSVRDHKFARGTVRRVVGFGRPYKRQVGILIGLILVDAALGAAVPLIYREIIDVGIADDRSTYVIQLALALAALAVVSSVNSLFQRWYSSRIGEGLIFDLRTRVFDHVQRQPIAFFTRTQTGSLVTRLNSDVIGAQQAFTSTLTNVVGNVATLAATLIAMLLLSWQITLLALLLLPMFILPARWIAPKLSAITRERYQVDAAMGQMMTERFNVSGALLVKLFGHPSDESAEFAGRAGRVRDIGVTTAMYGRVVMVVLTLMASLATALVYGLGGVFVVNGTLAIGTLVALTAYLNRLYAPLTALSNVQVDVMTTLVSFERVFEVLDLTPMVADPAQPVPIAAGPKSVRFNDVSFRYPAPAEVSIASLESVESSQLSSAENPMLLSGISFSIEPGELVALVGPSGAGKSTIASLVPRLYDVTAGEVLIGGVDVRDLDLDSLRQEVGVVSQDSHLFHDTLRRNLLLAKPDATTEELESALQAAQIWPLVAALPDGLETVVGDRGYRLSGGEKQRLAIARLLLKDPSVVVLDEATAHLDSESEHAVQLALANALEGRTSLVIAHRLSTIRDADQILVIDSGRVIERGNYDELLALGGMFADLVRTQGLGVPGSTHP